MSGTKAGGARAAATNLRKYGPNFYKQIGARGGKNSKTGGFASRVVGEDGLTGRERARVVGQVGGRISRRTKKVAV